MDSSLVARHAGGREGVAWVFSYLGVQPHCMVSSAYFEFIRDTMSEFTRSLCVSVEIELKMDLHGCKQV